MSIIDDMNWRYAVKEFDNTKKLSSEQLDNVLESLRLSSSSFGLQPWKFVVIETQSIKEKLLEHSWNQRQVVDASQVIVLCAPTNFGDTHINAFLESTAKTRNQSMESLDGYKKMMEGFLSRKDEAGLKVWMNKQIYIALGHMLTACAAMRIDTCPMEGFIASKYDEILNLKDKNLTSVVVCPVGFRSENDKYAHAGKVRYSKEEIFIHM